MALNALIEMEKDPLEKLSLINEDIALNELHIKDIRRAMPVKIVFCVLLSLFYGIGLFIFLPSLIIRKTRINICKDKIASLSKTKEKILLQIKQEETAPKGATIDL